MINFKNKVYIVTGATSGIGEQCAITLLEQGANVFLSGRNFEKLNELKEKYSQSSFYACDISKKDDCDVLIKNAVATFGPLDGLVHCAGISKLFPMRFYDEKDLLETLTTNLNSSFHLMASFRKNGNHKEKSQCVFFSSISATHGNSGYSYYAASKNAIEGAVKTWALELARDGIRVNAIAPGFIDTPMLQNVLSQMSDSMKISIELRHPLGFGKPQDVVNGVIFLLSDLSSWCTGITLSVDGGYHAS